MSKVLVVDDDRTMVLLLKTLLELDGFAVAIASNGTGVMDALRKHQPDVVLMDVHLADADGTEVLAAIRATDEFSNLPVVMCSGMDLEDRCRALGANQFILKPYSPEKLAGILQSALAPR